MNHVRVIRRATAGAAAVVLLLASTGPAGAVVKRKAAATQAPGIPTYGAPRTLLSGPAAPSGIAIDGAGNVFFANAASGQVMKVAPGSSPVVLFSALSTADVGQNGAIDSVALDGAGDLFVTDTGNNRVLELPKSGSQIVLPITGLSFPTGLAVDGAGDVFVADTYNKRVLELPMGGSQTVVPFTGLQFPDGLAVNGAGDLFLADSQIGLLKLPKGGTQVVVPVHGTGTDPAFPTGVTTDGSGNVFVTVYRLGVIELQVGGGQTLLPNPGLYDARGVAVDANGDVFVTDEAQNRIFEIHSGGTVTIFPPNSTARPSAVAADDTGNVFISDYTTNTVVELPHGGGTVITVPFAGLSSPGGVAVDGAGDVFVADSGNNRVVELPKGGPQVTVPFQGLTFPTGLAVDGAGDVFVTTGTEVIELPKSAAQVSLPFTGLATPVGVAVDLDGNVFVADAGKVVDVPCLGAPCQVVELHHGGGQTIFPVGSPANIAQEFLGVAVDRAGDLFIAGNGITEVPRGGGPSSITGLPFTTTNLQGVAVDRAGNLFIVDPTQNLVSELPVDQALFVNPINGQLNVASTQPFTWSTIPAAQGYFVTVGTTPYGQDLVSSGVLPASQSSLAVPVLPSGRLLYAALYTEDGGTWTRVQLVGFTAADRMAAFTYPVNGQANVDATKQFTWTPDSNGQAYILIVGTTRFGQDLVNSGILPARARAYPVPALPGGILYATLLTKVNGAWTRYRVASFTAASGGAHFTHPVNAQLNVDTTAPFTWSTVAQAQGYQMIVGTTVYGHDLVNSPILPPGTTSFAVPALPTGQVLYATVYTEINGGWVNYNLVGFTAAPGPPG